LRNPRRTRPTSDDVLAREFSTSVAASRYAAIYRDVLQ
jgi:hypothetical protein